MGGYAQATTNGDGLRLIAGMDLWGMKIQDTGKRIDVWKLQSSPYLEGQKLVLGEKEYLKQSYRFYQRDVAGED
jgi:hypothetical protein